MDKNKVWMILIIVVLVAMCAGLGFGFFYTINLVKGIEGTTDIPFANREDATYNPSDLITFNLSDAITTNLKDSPDGSEHVIKLSMSIGLNGNDKGALDFQAMLTDKEAFVRSTALRIIRSKTYEDLKEDNGQEALANELLESLQQEFNTNIIVSVVFGEFIHQ